MFARNSLLARVASSARFLAFSPIRAAGLQTALNWNVLPRPGWLSTEILPPMSFFGTSAQFWLNLQSLYDLRLAQEKAGKSIRALPTLKWRELVHA
jgi:hypothetical protein